MQLLKKIFIKKRKSCKQSSAQAQDIVDKSSKEQEDSSLQNSLTKDNVCKQDNIDPKRVDLSNGDDENKLDEKKCEILNKLALFVKKRRLETIAIMFLESTRPLHFLSAQALLFFEPFLNVLFNEDGLRLFREAMEEEKYLEYLIKQIEN